MSKNNHKIFWIGYDGVNGSGKDDMYWVSTRKPSGISGGGSNIDIKVIEYKALTDKDKEIAELKAELTKANDLGVKMSKVPIHHPSEVWDWYKEGNRHPSGSVAFVAWPDHVQSLADKDKTISDQSLTIRKQAVEIEELRKWVDKLLYVDYANNVYAEIEAKKAEVT